MWKEGNLPIGDSAAKVQFSPVLCLCGQNPEPDPWSGSGDLAEPRTGPQFGVHNGPVPVQGGCEPRTGREIRLVLAYVIIPNLQCHPIMYHKRRIVNAFGVELEINVIVVLFYSYVM